MEGDAGTRQLNPTDAEDAPDESVAASEPEQTDQEHRGQPTDEAAEELPDATLSTAVRRGWDVDGWPASARAWCS